MIYVLALGRKSYYNLYICMLLAFLFYFLHYFSTFLVNITSCNLCSANVILLIILHFDYITYFVETNGVILMRLECKVGSLITEQGLNSGCSRAPIPDATKTLFTRHETGETENQADLCSLGQSHSVLVARVHAVLLGQSTFSFRILRSFHIILLK